MKRIHWWLGLLVLSAVLVGLDLMTGPYVLFPIAFVIPACLGAWHLGRWPGIVFAIALVGCRLAIALVFEPELMPPWAAVMNAGIRLAVLSGLTLLVATIARQRRALTQRVQMLEGILPICMFCKKIRQADGTWEPIESYVSQRSPAQFSHGMCEACGRERYGEFYAPPAPPAAGSGA